jgi:hypothetical protein
VLIRANAVFAVAPLVVGLAEWPAGLRGRVVAGLAIVAASILLSPLINHGLLRASASGVERTLPIYDLAGITAHGGAPGALTPAEQAVILNRHCYKPFFWDPLGAPERCGDALQRLNDEPGSALFGGWIGAVLLHPIAYAEHRIGHFNSTERWWVGPSLPDGIPPQTSQPNTLGLATPGHAARRFQRLGGGIEGTPVGWPIAWVVIAATACWAAALQPPTGQRNVAIALFTSALALEASFAVVSIASDLRYHLWAMLGTAIGVMLLNRRPPNRVLATGAAALGLVIAIGSIARATLPRAPASYDAMLVA